MNLVILSRISPKTQHIPNPRLETLTSFSINDSQQVQSDNLKPKKTLQIINLTLKTAIVHSRITTYIMDRCIKN